MRVYYYLGILKLEKSTMAKLEKEKLSYKGKQMNIEIEKTVIIKQGGPTLSYFRFPKSEWKTWYKGAYEDWLKR